MGAENLTGIFSHDKETPFDGLKGLVPRTLFGKDLNKEIFGPGEMCHINDERDKIAISLVAEVNNFISDVLYSYFEFMMREKYGPSWEREVYDFVREKQKDTSAPHTYKNNWRSLVSGDGIPHETTFLRALLIDFADDCSFRHKKIPPAMRSRVLSADKKKYKRAITSIKDARNSGSHLDARDSYASMQACRNALNSVQDFIHMLDSDGIDWAGNDKKRIAYLNHVNSRVVLFYQRLYLDNPSLVAVSFFARDMENHPVPGVSFSFAGESAITLVTTDDPYRCVSVQLPMGNYIPENIVVPDGYKLLRFDPFQVSSDSGSLRIIIEVEKILPKMDRYNAAFEKLDSEITRSDGIKELIALDKENSTSPDDLCLEATLLLSFLYRYSVYVRGDIRKANDLLIFARLYQPEDEWAEYAGSFYHNGNDYGAIAYYLGDAMANGVLDGYVFAGAFLSKKGILYELCKKCYEVARGGHKEDYKMQNTEGLEERFDSFFKMAEEEYQVRKM